MATVFWEISFNSKVKKPAIAARGDSRCISFANELHQRFRLTHLKKSSTVLTDMLNACQMKSCPFAACCCCACCTAHNSGERNFRT
jgi:hypothetical protein